MIKADSDTVLERPLLSASALLKGVQMVDDWVDYFLEADQFMDRCRKFLQEMGDAMAPQRDTYIYIQGYS